MKTSKSKSKIDKRTTKVQKITARQLKFCAEYLKDLNGTQAAIRAGFSAKTADSQVTRLLKNVRIKKEIAKRIALREKRAELTGDLVIAELRKIGFADIRKLYDVNGSVLNIKDLPDDVATAVVSFEADELFEGVGLQRREVGETKKIKLADKVKALNLLGNHFGIFKKEVEVAGVEKIADIMERDLEYRKRLKSKD